MRWWRFIFPLKQRPKAQHLTPCPANRADRANSGNLRWSIKRRIQRVSSAIGTMATRCHFSHIEPSLVVGCDYSHSTPWTLDPSFCLCPEKQCDWNVGRSNLREGRRDQHRVWTIGFYQIWYMGKEHRIISLWMWRGSTRWYLFVRYSWTGCVSQLSPSRIISEKDRQRYPTISLGIVLVCRISTRCTVWESKVCSYFHHELWPRMSGDHCTQASGFGIWRTTWNGSVWNMWFTALFNHDRGKGRGQGWCSYQWGPQLLD